MLKRADGANRSGRWVRWAFGACGAALLIVAVDFAPAEAGHWNRPRAERQTKFFSFSSNPRRYRKPRIRRRAKRLRARRKARPAPAPLWQSAGNSNDPVQIVISLPKQRMVIYKGGVAVASSRVSTGRPGYETPDGVYSILQKRKIHYSNLYNSAPMPHMQRLTWSGIALHGGPVPDYPASHGCIRLPYSFASQLFSYTSRGAHVVILRGDAAPEKIEHRALIQPTPLAAITGTRTVRVGEAATGESMAMPVRRVAKMEPAARLSPAEASAQLASFEDTLARVEAYKARSNKPLRILVTRRSALERRKDVQRLLRKIGYYEDRIDGLLGTRSRAAIRLFQLRADLAPTGRLSDEFIDALYRAAGETENLNGRLYVRQGFAEFFEARVAIREPEKPIGTHLYTVMDFDRDATRAQWTALTLKSRRDDGQDTLSSRRRDGRVRLASANDRQISMPPAKAGAWQALERIGIPDVVRQRLSDMLTPGSSIVITDKGRGAQTGKGTDFIVRP